MSFLGKKFRRVGCENVEQLVSSNGSELLKKMLTTTPPIISLSRVDEESLMLSMYADDRVLTSTFKLGQEFEMEKMDGAKVKLTYTIEGDVFTKRMKLPDGKTLLCRNEFNGDKSIMTVKLEGTNIEAKIFYETVK